jgi:ADP-heptose:LPS heptosyltransferase
MSDSTSAHEKNRSVANRLFGSVTRLRSAARMRLYFAAVHAYIFWITLRLVMLRAFRGKRLLVVMRAGGLGDVIASQPALAALRKQYPDRHLVYCTRPEFRPIAACLPGVDCVLPVFHGDRLAVFAGRWFDTRRFRYLDEYDPQGSTRCFVEEMAGSVGITLPADAAPRIEIAAMSDAEFAEWFGTPRAGRRIIALHAGPSAPVREWPHQHWQNLAAMLVRDSGLAVVQIGSGRHFIHGGKDNTIPGALQPLRQLSLVESARLLKSCTCMVGIDSGPLHLAAAVGTRAIGIFGPVNPRLRLPPGAQFVVAEPPLPCQFCHHRNPRGHWETGCNNEVACMRTISVASVLSQFTELIG